MYRIDIFAVVVVSLTLVQDRVACEHSSEIVNMPLTAAGLESMSFSLWEKGEQDMAARSLKAAKRMGLHEWTAKSRKLSQSKDVVDMFNAYKHYHDSVILKLKHRVRLLPNDGRFLVYRPSEHGEGWGNRATSMACVFAACLCFRRVMIVDWSSDYNLSDYVQPPFAWDPHEAIIAAYPSLLNVSATTIRSAAEVQGAKGFDLFAGGEVVVTYAGYDGFPGELLRNKHSQWLKRLCKASDSFEMLGCMMQLLYRPSSHIQNVMMQQWIPRIQEQALISVVIRTHHKMADADGEKLIVRCAAQLAESIPTSVIYLATDERRVRKWFSMQLGDSHTVLHGDDPIVHTGEGKFTQFGGTAIPTDDLQNPRGKSSLTQVFVDWWLIAASSDAVLTDRSSFGYSARAMNPEYLKPITVANNDLTCTRRVWLGHTCGNNPC